MTRTSDRSVGLLAGVLAVASLTSCSSGSGADRDAAEASVAVTSPSASMPSGSASPEDASTGPAGSWLVKDTRLCITNEATGPNDIGYEVVPVGGTKGPTVDSDDIARPAGGTATAACYENGNNKVTVGSQIRLMFDDGTSFVVALNNAPFGRPDLTICRRTDNSAFCNYDPRDGTQWSLSQGDAMIVKGLGHNWRLQRDSDTDFIEVTVATLPGSGA